MLDPYVEPAESAMGMTVRSRGECQANHELLDIDWTTRALRLTRQLPTRSEAAGEHPTADCEYMSESAADEEENEIIVGRWRPPPIQQTIPSNAAAGCNLKWKGEGAPRRWMIQLMVGSYLRYTD